MSKYDYDLGVIGGGAAGLTAAAGAAKAGAKTILIEKEPELGGDCLHFGCVPSKTLIKTAAVYHQTRRLAAYGLPEVDPPAVDYRKVADRIQGVISRIQKHDSVERFCRLGVQVETGAPEFVDDHAVRLNGRTIAAKDWALAAGASPRLPNIEGLGPGDYLTNKDIFSLDKLPESMICIGGGPIGMEMAQAFARLGTRVTVLQRSDQILEKEDRDMADWVMTRLQSEGVGFYLGAHILRGSVLNGRKQVVFQDADGREKTVSAEAVLAAVGRAPNTGGLGLDQAGVEHTDAGVAVDDRMRTSQKHIYAAGDVTGRYFFTHAAGYEGGLVVANAVFHLPRKADYRFLPWCTYVQPELASIGLNEKAAREKGLEYQVHTSAFEDNDRAQAEGETEGRLKMIMNHKNEVVGVQILGPSAGDLLGEWAAVLGGGVKTSTLAGAVHPYPTLAEINKAVAGEFIGEKVFSETVKKVLKFFFHFKGRACRPPEAAGNGD